MSSHLWKMAATLLTLRFLPPAWQLSGFLMLGAIVGLGGVVLHVSRAASYLSDAPETCMNCHVMATEYVTWQHSSHAQVTTCNDCHVPHGSRWEQYRFKARDGLWHATVFTLRWEPQVIRLSQGAVPVVQQNCRRCHAPLIAEVSLAECGPGEARCWDCHRELPHGAVRSLSATAGIFRPRLPPVGTSLRPPQIGGRDVRPGKEPSHE